MDLDSDSSVCHMFLYRRPLIEKICSALQLLLPSKDGQKYQSLLYPWSVLLHLTNPSRQIQILVTFLVQMPVHQTIVSSILVEQRIVDYTSEHCKAKISKCTTAT